MGVVENGSPAPGSTVPAPVVDRLSGPAHGEADELPEELKQFGSPQRIDAVRRATEYLDEHGVTVTRREDSGDTAQDVVDLADSEDVDLSVLGGRKSSPAATVRFGTITQSVLLRTDRPVAVTGSKRE